MCDIWLPQVRTGEKLNSWNLQIVDDEFSDLQMKPKVGIADWAGSKKEGQQKNVDRKDSVE